MAAPQEFFREPILNSPYAYPARHWELDKDGQPTNLIRETRRLADFVTPIPKSLKCRAAPPSRTSISASPPVSPPPAKNAEIAPIINQLRFEIEKWRLIPNPVD